jgi:hypothetical protein
MPECDRLATLLVVELLPSVLPVARETECVQVRRLGSPSLDPTRLRVSPVKESMQTANTRPSSVAGLHLIGLALENCLKGAVSYEIAFLEGMVVSLPAASRLEANLEQIEIVSVESPINHHR